MSITKILGNEKMPNEEKLEAVAKVVAGARESYGNSDVDIKPIKVNTTHGMLPFTHLEDDSKVELLMNEALNIKAAAIQAVESTTGLVLNKKVQELIATSPLFANVAPSTDFEYL